MYARVLPRALTHVGTHFIPPPVRVHVPSHACMQHINVLRRNVKFLAHKSHKDAKRERYNQVMIVAVAVVASAVVVTVVAAAAAAVEEVACGVVSVVVSVRVRERKRERGTK